MIRNTKLASEKDYRIVSGWLKCRQIDGRLLCVQHNAVWIHDRCMVANDIALKLSSRLARMEQKIARLALRPAPLDIEGIRTEAFVAGYREAVKAAARKKGGRAIYNMRRHFQQLYGKPLD